MRNNDIFERFRADVAIPVPDVWEKIKEDYANNTFAKVPAKGTRRFAAAHYITAAICIAFVAVAGSRLFSTGHFPPALENGAGLAVSNAGSAAPAASESSQTAIAVEQEQPQSTNNAGTVGNAPSEPAAGLHSQNNSVFFNAAVAPPAKIGGIVRSVDSDDWNRFYSVKALPYNVNYKLLYQPNTEIDSESVPTAGIQSYTEGEAWFTIAVSRTQKLQDAAVDSPVTMKIGDTDVIFASYEKIDYASFTFGNNYYSIETGGYLKSKIVELVNQLVS